MLRTEPQFTCHRNQIADDFQAILLRNRLGDSDAVGVVDAQLTEHFHAILLLDLSLGVVVQGLAFGHITGVLLEEGGEDSAVIGVHDVAAGVLPGELPEHIHAGHLILDGHFHIGFILHQDLHHLVDQLHFGVDAVIEDDLRAGITGTAGEYAGHEHG